MTATGPVAANELGQTLMHEHIYVNLMREFRGTGLLNDHQEAVEELAAFAALGGGTIVDATPAELSAGAAPDPGGWRDPAPPESELSPASRTATNALALRDLSEQTGVRIVLGTGHYRDPHLTRTIVQSRDPEEVAEQLILDIREGFAGTGVRAGIIGEVGAERWFISELEHRSFLAAARAHRCTALPVTTHAARWPNGLLQLDLLAEYGVPPEAAIIGHCDTVPIPEYHQALAARGAYVQFDTFRHASGPHFERRVDFILKLVAAGFADQILVSHDVCETTHLRSNGGQGFTAIPSALRQRLEDLDMPEVYQAIMVTNPSRVFGG
ncbi:phosphotriesterase family protein [Ruania halotolerans]|uniref:phosphotriesterase family protein n=1 Tax=Ruania halotolerans TaxID=2897773 RepID=UPI001E37E1D0|nr:hypothetical protein [Ruania halotolerans]UFU06603.1 hypothetical protein LQF10_00370 [Ruania halotolerans]